MTTINKRDLLFAIAAVGVGAAAPGPSQAQTAIDLSAGRAVGEAYLASHPETDPDQLRQRLLPSGLDTAAIAHLRTRAAADFQAGRIFMHRGWRLSETEAQLFAVLIGVR